MAEDHWQPARLIPTSGISGQEEAERDADSISFSWSTTEPPLHAHYRLEWEFRPMSNTEEPPDRDLKPSEVMASFGIVQRGDSSLGEPTRSFALPDEAEEARRVVAQLQAVAERVSRAHTFVKGVGLAAPQIGIDRAAAIVKRPDGEPIILLNPRIIDESTETTRLYEGCLSFFDVRGIVPRPLAIEVEHEALDGSKRITHFERGIARLVAHEIDHLNGTLYINRMEPGVDPIPIEEYRGTGQAWAYS
jgi:peptide deformylase